MISETLLIYGLIGASSVLLLWNIILEWRFRRLTKGASGRSLEQHVARIAKDYQDFIAFKKIIEGRANDLDTRLKGSMRGIGMVRFNPFAGSGLSKPSFAATFISENGDGLVISSLHARESLSIFTKTIKGFKSQQELTEEEMASLEKARVSLHTSN